MSSRSDWPIVVGGCHRTGTSLVRRLLDAHPRIHCGPELGFFRDFYGEYRSDPLAHLRFPATARSMLSEHDALVVLGEALVSTHERAAQQVGKQRWADKAPENVLYLDAWQALLGDGFLFVHVVRNPLDTVSSMRGRFPLTLPDRLDEQAQHYRRYTLSGLRFEAARPARALRIHYEELCTAPESVLVRLMEWLGEGLDPGQLAFNDVRHETGLEDPAIGGTTGVHAQSVGRWRSVLSCDEARLVWRITHDAWLACEPPQELRDIPNERGSVSHEDATI